MKSPFVRLATLQAAACFSPLSSHGGIHATDVSDAGQVVDRLFVALPADWLLLLHPALPAHRRQKEHPV